MCFDTEAKMVFRILPKLYIHSLFLSFAFSWALSLWFDFCSGIKKKIFSLPQRLLAARVHCAVHYIFNTSLDSIIVDWRTLQGMQPTFMMTMCFYCIICTASAFCWLCKITSLNNSWLMLRYMQHCNITGLLCEDQRRVLWSLTAVSPTKVFLQHCTRVSRFACCL